MRLWSICRASSTRGGLIALWREGLFARAALGHAARHSYAKSLMDYFARWLDLKFLSGD